MTEIPDCQVNDYLKALNHYFDGIHVEQTCRGIAIRTFDATLTTPYAQAAYWSPTKSFREGVISMARAYIDENVLVDFNNTGTTFWIKIGPNGHLGP